MHFLLTREFSETTIHPIDPRTNLTFSEVELLRSSKLWNKFLAIAFHNPDVIGRSVQTQHVDVVLSWWREARARSEQFERAMAEKCWAEVTRQLDLFEDSK